MKIVGVLSALAAIVISSCSGDGSLLPKSGGRPYEVLVVSVGSGRGAASVDSVLSLDVPGLPQSEPMFDVSLTDSAHFNQTAKLARSIVVVNVNPHLFTTTRIRYEKNVWARPQIVAYVNAASDSVACRHASNRHTTRQFACTCGDECRHIAIRRKRQRESIGHRG